MINGYNFTYQTQCVIDGTIVSTTYVTSSLIECTVPIGYAGEEKSV